MMSSKSRRRHLEGYRGQGVRAGYLDAVATYLLGDSPPAPPSLAAPDPADVATDENGAGRISYVALCAGSYGLEGNGMPNTVVAMRNNSTLRLADPRNLIVAMLDGIGARTSSEHAGDAWLRRQAQ
jgi:hypothetical protein